MTESTLFSRKFGERTLVTLNRVKLISKPNLEIRQVKGIPAPQHFGTWSFEVETSEDQIFTIRIGEHARERDIEQVNSFPDDGFVDLVLNPHDWEIGDRSGTKLYLVEIKES